MDQEKLKRIDLWAKATFSIWQSCDPEEIEQEIDRRVQAVLIAVEAKEKDKKVIEHLSSMHMNMVMTFHIFRQLDKFCRSMKAQHERAFEPHKSGKCNCPNKADGEHIITSSIEV
jgi:hypothetical protein